MTRGYTVRAVAEGDLAHDLPVSLVDVPLSRSEQGKRIMFSWRFDEARFKEIPTLRRHLADRALDLLEEGMRIDTASDVARAELLLLTGGKFTGATLDAPNLVTTKSCAGCGMPVQRIDAKPGPKLLVRDAKLPAFFWINESGVRVASAAFLEALDQSGLAGGLGRLNLRVSGAKGAKYFCVFPTVDVGWPAGPFGYWGVLCSVCGRPVRHSLWAEDPRPYPALARYAFYETFHRPSVPADWMWTELSGQLRFLISGRVRDWLKSEATNRFDLSWNLPEGFNLSARGWYPDDAEAAFLEVPYRGPPGPGQDDSGNLTQARAAVERFLEDSSSGKSSSQSLAASSSNPATRMFAAWSGQDAARVGRDPQALLDGLRAVGADVREILRDAVSGDPARHARAEARLAELRRLQAEAGLGSDAPVLPSTDNGDDPDSPEARFRGRLQTILEEAVGRLERLKTEVEATRPGAKSASDDEAAPRTGEAEGKKRS